MEKGMGPVRVAPSAFMTRHRRLAAKAGTPVGQTKTEVMTVPTAEINAETLEPMKLTDLRHIAQNRGLSPAGNRNEVITRILSGIDEPEGGDADDDDD